MRSLRGDGSSEGNHQPNMSTVWSGIDDFARAALLAAHDRLAAGAPCWRAPHPSLREPTVPCIYGVLAGRRRAQSEKSGHSEGQARSDPDDVDQVPNGRAEGRPSRNLAVTSISIRMRLSASPTYTIVAAGRTSPNHWRSSGQHRSRSAASARK